MPQQLASTSCRDCIFRSLLFNKLSNCEFEQLENSKIELKFKKGEKVISEGQIIRNFFYLKSGLVKLSKRTNDNKDHIVSVAKTKSFFGFLTMFSNKNYQYTITTLSESDFCFIDIDLIRRFVSSNGEFALDVLSKVSRVTDEIIYNRVNICSKQLRGRVAYLLKLLSEEVFLNTTFFLPLTRREIGELIDMSTENVIRVLSEFKKDGVLNMTDHQIQITNYEALNRIWRNG